jgi:hypothetical protein
MANGLTMAEFNSAYFVWLFNSHVTIPSCIKSAVAIGHHDLQHLNYGTGKECLPIQS